jgi:predicted permease
MSWQSIGLRLRALLGRGTVEREMDTEMQFHLEMETQKHVRAGMAPAAARRRALLSFGGVERHRESVRDGRGTRWIEDFIRDLRYAARTLVRNPGFALASIITLGLAIGINGAVFTVVNGLILRPFQVPQPERLVSLFTNDPTNGGANEVGYDDFLDWRDRSGLFSGLAAQSTAPLSFSTGTGSEVVWSELVSGNYFSVLGLRPLLGRFFVAGEEARQSAAPYVVLSYDLWHQHFRGDSSVIGRIVRVNRAPAEIIGVAPRHFYGIRRFGFWPDLWMPLGASGTAALAGRGDGSLITIGRLRPGLTLEQAESQAAAFAQGLAEAHPASNRGIGAMLISARTPFDSPRFVQPRILILSSMLGMIGVGLILLIACANVANLMLARAAARRREMAVRLSIGGSRGRLIRQLLTESALISALGGLVAIPLTLLAMRWQSALVPQLQFRVGLIMTIDQRVMLFTGLLAFAAVFLFGLAPALQATRVDLVGALRNEPAAVRHRRRPQLRNLLVAGQLAMSVVLLICGTLFMRSLRATRDIDLGVIAADRVLVSANPDVQGYDARRSQAYYQQARQRVTQLSGVVSAAWAFPAPFDTYGRSTLLYIPGVTERSDRPATSVSLSVVDPGYFKTVGTRLAGGREFVAGDSANTPNVMIVTRAFANRFFPGRDVIGQRLRFRGPEGDEVQIVGLVEDAIYGAPTQQPQPYAFFPVAQTSTSGLTLIVQTQPGAEGVLPQVRSALNAVDPEVATYGAMTMARSVRNATNAQESAASIASILALLALVLAMVGLYGVVAYTVERRTREVGIRIALGAKPSAVVGLVLGHTARTTLIGVGVGLIGAFGVAQLLRSILYGVTATDPLTFIAIPLLLSAVALLASYIPARRASRVHPMQALRQD